MTATGEQLVEEYLRRFDNASVFLTDERRAELRQEIIEHITAGVDVASIEEAGAADADAVRRVLDRLGPPADIVAAETGSGTTGSTPVVDRGPAPRPTSEGDEQGPERHGTGHRGHEGHGAEGGGAEGHGSRPAHGTPPGPRAASYGESAGSPSGTLAPRPSARFRKGPLLLIAGAATAVLLATVAVASDISGGESGPAVERTPMPTQTATESGSPSETPTETPTETPAETAGESSSPPSSLSSSPAAAPESSSASPEDTTNGPTPTDTSE